MKPNKLKAIVCGATFGQFYLASLKILQDHFEVVGLLSRGSDRSKKCAKQYGVPLLTSIKEIPDTVDLACVVLRSGVMGGEGTKLSLTLLEKGIHVLQEHPVHHKDLAACLRAAQKNKVLFRTGDLYIHLPEVRRFITCCRSLSKQQKPIYIEAAYASQVSYPLLHILSEALTTTRPWSLDQVSKTKGPFQVLTGVIGGVPLILRVHNEVNPNDPDNHLHLLHRITIGFEGGSLSLTDTHGPVVWNPRMHVPEDVGTMKELSEAEASFLTANSVEILGKHTPLSYREILTKQWPAAIGVDLLEIKEGIVTGTKFQTKSQNELLISKQWQDITNMLGYPSMVPNSVHQPLSVSTILEAGEEKSQAELLYER
ncbi:Gfo/Idh/MocA family oxidoreductase [Aquimarina hainanensis]|uniref:Gfo/Idh/MocA family oxidoreductase n=1 Tax=Aquimarina hainanensis TaxID=1578017 RepID=A0ABW5N6Z5_9FLAO